MTDVLAPARADRQAPSTAPPIRDSVHGFLAPDHPLSARTAVAGLAAPLRVVFGHPYRDVWETETDRLPRSLQGVRRRARAFAQTELAPLALQIDAAPHRPLEELQPELQRLLVTAGRAGWMSEFLPKPIGSGSLAAARHSMPMTASLKVEEFSRACGGLMLFLCAHMLGQIPLLLSADPALIRRRLVPALRSNMAGDPYLFAFAITEPGAGSDVEDGHGASFGRPDLVARRVAGGWLLNGRKVYISGGDIAHGFTVFAALEGEGYESWTCFFVERGAPGFRRLRTELKMGMRASGAAELEFTDVFVPDADIVGKLRGGWSLNHQTLNISRVPVASMGVGFAQAACDIAVDYACRTVLGGRPLIDQQSVQLVLADVLAATSSIRAHVWQTASSWRVRQYASAMNKFHATDTAMQVIEQCMDLLGLDSLLHRNRLEKVWRDCRLTQIFEGTNQINHLSVIEDLQDHFVRPALPGRL